MNNEIKNTLKKDCSIEGLAFANFATQSRFRRSQENFTSQNLPCELNDDHWAVYLRRLKQEAEREINEIDIRHAGLEEGIAIGEKRGISIGEKRGRKEGKQEAKRETAHNLLQQGVDIAIISSATGLSEDEILQLK